MNPVAEFNRLYDRLATDAVEIPESAWRRRQDAIEDEELQRRRMEDDDGVREGE